MEIREVGDVRTGTANRRSLPVASGQAKSKSRAPIPLRSESRERAQGLRRLHHRPSAAFLAQLAIQYDTITEARRVRRARMKAALASYSGAKPVHADAVKAGAENDVQI